MNKFFLIKTDPDTYSVSDFSREKETFWDGVHNFQALNFIKQWEIGDKLIVYHSQKEARIVGLAEVIGMPEPDPNDKRTSFRAKVRFIKEFEDDKKITLKEIKQTELFNDFFLVRQSRLSVMPCPDSFILWLKQKGLEL